MSIHATRTRLGNVIVALCMLVCIWGPPSFRPLNDQIGRMPRESLEGRLDVYAFFQIGVWLGVAAIVFIGLLRALTRDGAPVRRFLLRGSTGWYLGFGLLCCASTLWSPGAALTGFRAMQLVVLQILIWVLAEHDEDKLSWRHPMQLLTGFCFFNAFSTVVLYHVDASLVSVPTFIAEEGLRERVIGGGPFRPDWGLAGLVLLTFGVRGLIYGRSAFGSRLYHGALLALACYELYLSHTRTYLFGGLAAILALLFFRTRGTRRAALVVLVALAGVAILEWGQTVIGYVYRGQDSLATMTGRTELWPSYIEGASHAPLLGFGYAAGARYLGILWQDDNFGSAHNAFLAVLVDVGGVGLAIILVCLALATRDAFRVLSGPLASVAEGAYAQAASLLVAVLVASIPSDVFAANTHTLDLVIFVIALTSLRVACAGRDPSAAGSGSTRPLHALADSGARS